MPPTASDPKPTAAGRAAPGSPARQALLLELTDVLRGSGTINQVLERVCAALGPWFDVNRVGYGHVDASLDAITYDVCWVSHPSVPPLLGTFPEWHVWASALGYSAALWIVAWLLFARVRGRLAFWV